MRRSFPASRKFLICFVIALLETLNCSASSSYVHVGSLARISSIFRELFREPFCILFRLLFCALPPPIVCTLRSPYHNAETTRNLSKKRCLEPIGLAHIQKVCQSSPHCLNVLDLVHGSGYSWIDCMRFVFLVKIRDADRTMEASGADDLDAIRIDLNLDAADARIVSVGNCVVHGLGDHTVRYLVHVVCGSALSMFPRPMARRTTRHGLHLCLPAKHLPSTDPQTASPTRCPRQALCHEGCCAPRPANCQRPALDPSPDT